MEICNANCACANRASRQIRENSPLENYPRYGKLGLGKFAAKYCYIITIQHLIFDNNNYNIRYIVVEGRKRTGLEKRESERKCNAYNYYIM